MSDELKSQIADVIEKHVGYTNGWAVPAETYRSDAEEAAAEILALVATPTASTAEEVTQAIDSLIVAVRNTESCTDRYHSWKAADSALAKCRADLIALVAGVAPPVQTVEEVREMLERYVGLRLYYGSTRPGEKRTADREEVAALESRLLSLLACAAPVSPEGAPTYAELVEVLREWDADATERTETWGLNPNQRRIHELTRDLLSRIPKVENAK